MIPVSFLFKIDRETWRQFKACCALKGRTLHEAVVELVRRTASGEIQLDDDESRRTKERQK